MSDIALSLTKHIEKYRKDWNKRLSTKSLNSDDTLLVDLASRSNSQEFSAKLYNQLGINDLDLEVIDFWNPNLQDPFTRGEYLDLSVELESRLFSAWQIIAPTHAWQPEYWTICNLVLLKLDIVTPEYLIGRGRLQANISDDYYFETRRMLMRLGGESRDGYRSVFTACPVARAWWRVWLAKSASQNFPNFSERDAHTYLNKSNQSWETLVGHMVNQATSLTDPVMRAAVISDMKNHSLGRDEFRLLLSKVAELGIGKHFNSMGVDLCIDIVSKAHSLINS